MSLKIEKFFASITDNSAIVCDELIETYNEEVKVVYTNFNKKIYNFKTQNNIYFTNNI